MAWFSSQASAWFLADLQQKNLGGDTNNQVAVIIYCKIFVHLKYELVYVQNSFIIWAKLSKV